MKQVIIQIPNRYYERFLRLLGGLDYAKVLSAADAEGVSEKPDYDFSDLAGKLEWKGDAVMEQQKLRDEW